VVLTALPRPLPHLFVPSHPPLYRHLPLPFSPLTSTPHLCRRVRVYSRSLALTSGAVRRFYRPQRLPRLCPVFDAKSARLDFLPLPSPILLSPPSAIYPIKPLVLMPNAEQLQPDAIPFDCAFLPRFPPPHDNEEQLIVSFVRPHPSCSIVPCTAICCRECRRTGRSSLRRQEGGADLPQGASRSCLQGFRQAGTA
jgi:hypothetical protein